MTSAHAYELPPDEGVPVAAVDAAEHGEVVYLTRNGARVAAVVPVVLAEQAEHAGERLSQRLAAAGLLAEVDPLDVEPPDPAAVAAARDRAGLGRPLSDYVTADR